MARWVIFKFVERRECCLYKSEHRANTRVLTRLENDKLSNNSFYIYPQYLHEIAKNANPINYISRRYVL